MKNTSFSDKEPMLQLAWDSTSLRALLDCPRKYYFSTVLGRVPREPSVHLTFGILYHEALELYDKLRADGSDHEAALRGAVRQALCSTWDIGRGRPINLDHPNKNRLTLVRTVVWYLETFKHDPLQTIIKDGFRAIELSFRFQLPFTTLYSKEPFLLCGHLDKIGHLDDGSVGGSSWILDRKTSYHQLDERYFAQFSPDIQMSTYDFAGAIIYQLPIKGVLVDAAQVLVSGSRFARKEIPRTASQREEYLRVIHHYIRQAEGYAAAAHWPPNFQSCHKYAGCEYRGVCSKAPEVRDTWLKAFTVERTWDPLQSRGDV